MYCKYYGLQSQPFKLTPDTQRFFSGGQRGAVLETLRYAILSREGIVKLTGEVGSGKTMLCRMLAASMPRSVEVVYIANPSLSPEDILHAIAYELGIALDQRAGRLSVVHAIQHHLLQRHAQNKQTVLFIEEAQGMPFETLEEIRFLSNLETDEDKLLQIVLFGQPELDQRLATHELRQLRDRITHSINLEPLNAAQTREYIEFRLRAAGYHGGELMHRGVYRAINRATKGLMRRINTLADKTLLAAYVDGSVVITRRHVRRALQDSEFRPRRSVAWRIIPWSVACVVGLLGITGYIAPPLSAADQGAYGARATAPAAPATVRNDAADIAGSAWFDAAGEYSPLRQRIASAQDVFSAQKGGYTIQLLLTEGPDVSGLEKMLQDPAITPHLERLYVYETHINGIPRWSVVYGVYASYRAAHEQLDTVPKAFQVFQPYIRTLAAVNKENASARGGQRQDIS